MPHDLCLTVAERQIRNYTENSVPAFAVEYQNAVECVECEEFLERGIKAYQFVKHADEFFREADYAGIADFTPEMQYAIGKLYISWLERCPDAEGCIAQNIAQGHLPKNLEKFREICEEVQDVVQSREWQHLAKTAREITSATEAGK